MNVKDKAEKDYTVSKFYDTFLLDFNLKYRSDHLKVSSGMTMTPYLGKIKRENFPKQYWEFMAYFAD